MQQALACIGLGALGTPLAANRLTARGVQFLLPADVVLADLSGKGCCTFIDGGASPDWLKGKVLPGVAAPHTLSQPAPLRGNMKKPWPEALAEAVMTMLP